MMEIKSIRYKKLKRENYSDTLIVKVTHKLVSPVWHSKHCLCKWTFMTDCRRDWHRVYKVGEQMSLFE